MPLSRYQMDYIPPGGTTTPIAKIRVATATEALTINSVANDAATGEVSFPIQAKVSNHKRQRGLRPTIAVLRATTAIGNFTAAAVVRVPLLNLDIKAAAQGATAATAVTYRGTSTWEVSYVEDEVIK